MTGEKQRKQIRLFGSLFFLIVLFYDVKGVSCNPTKIFLGLLVVIIGKHCLSKCSLLCCLGACPQPPSYDFPIFLHVDQ